MYYWKKKIFIQFDTTFIAVLKYTESRKDKIQLVHLQPLSGLAHNNM